MISEDEIRELEQLYVVVKGVHSHFIIFQLGHKVGEVCDGRDLWQELSMENSEFCTDDSEDCEVDFAESLLDQLATAACEKNGYLTRSLRPQSNSYRSNRHTPTTHVPSPL